MQYLIGPFQQVITMAGLSLRGPLSDEQLEIVSLAGIVVENDTIVEAGNFDRLMNSYPEAQLELLKGEYVAFPSMIDVHTHCCWAGSRAGDYAARTGGKSYLEIAATGGGIMDTVRKTRAATKEELAELTLERANTLFARGITTVEIKSGYGLSVDEELKLLEAIQKAGLLSPADLIPTCLAAHTIPTGFRGDERAYLHLMRTELLPEIKKRGLADRVDIFIEKGAFSVEAAREYLLKAKELGFDVVVHGDQFSSGTAKLAVELEAVSIDHLEAADEDEITILSKGNVIPVALPGASLGLGEPFAPARKLLDAGTSLVIASDWNPGSAPMGNLVAQASILGMAQKLSMAEVWAALTFRAAAALGLSDRGRLEPGMKADFIIYSTNDYREVLYRQGELIPSYVFKNNILYNRALLNKI